MFVWVGRLPSARGPAPPEGCANLCTCEWEALCLCQYQCESVDKYAWHWEIVHGCEKEIVDFGVTITARLSVNRSLFSSLCHCYVGEAAASHREREVERVSDIILGGWMSMYVQPPEKL